MSMTSVPKSPEPRKRDSYPALKGAAVHGRNSFLSRGGGSVGIEFDARQVGTPFFGYFDQRGAVSDTRVDGSIRSGRNQERPNVLGLFDRQRMVTEFEPTRVPHGSSQRLKCDPLGCV